MYSNTVMTVYWCTVVFNSMYCACRQTTVNGQQGPTTTYGCNPAHRSDQLILDQISEVPKAELEFAVEFFKCVQMFIFLTIWQRRYWPSGSSLRVQALNQQPSWSQKQFSIHKYVDHRWTNVSGTAQTPDQFSSVFSLGLNSDKNWSLSYQKLSIRHFTENGNETGCCQWFQIDKCVKVKKHFQYLDLANEECMGNIKQIVRQHYTVDKLS